ncbi:FAD binding domain-containing protein [Dothidotthia symphoricarpi CBS 119687]|uniref:FAD binding domain-containing protein n=1 Tax=Dothidotthia symphoricarpi CBS 119687 TaxID=1392245 RepID=A0A6A6A0C4_9PLEO|nr:FAD binding domain-containing protein [Dothidotthia symphoricarpi CBS 119687]KAF2124148.1 FAD binding domain-containing protein [Dothidotthia symphoricarpi CBS 119687]
MKFITVVSLSAIAAGGLAGTFEPTDFNVTEALIANGVNVSAIPELEGLVERSSPSACSIACKTLEVTFGNSSVLSEGSSAYKNFTSAYWSAQQSTVSPYCVFKPTKALQVSTLVLLSRLTQCPFAVKGGGHAAFPGASSIEGGITVAMEKMNEVSLSSDKSIASVGPGNLWLNVYKTLEQHGLVVMGGRVATVGVAGLTLGGGISHFANAHGWACDNVDSFEVVTASGTIVTASATSFPDLYWALRGGGNNVGIVTKFNMRTFPHGEMWGGPRVHLESEWDAVYQAYYNLARDAANDTKQAQIVSFMLRDGTKMAMVDLEYSDPTPWPSIFDEWKGIPAISDTTGINNLSQLTINMGAGIPEGIQELYWDKTFKLDRDLFKFSIDTFFEMVDTMQDVANLFPVLSFQAITVPAMEKMQQNGGNALGLDSKNGPIFISNLAMMWTDSADAARVASFTNELEQRLTAEAKAKGLDNDFIYMNYASFHQDVVASYGSASKQKLKTIAAKYDPTAVFQKLQPGYFKLEGAPFGPYSG